MKKWILCMLCLVFLLSIAGCGSQPKTATAAEEMITATLTPQYAPDITDEWLEANIGTYYQSFERQVDNSIILKMTTEQYANYLNYIRSGIISIAQNMVANDHTISRIFRIMMIFPNSRSLSKQIPFIVLMPIQYIMCLQSMADSIII